MVEDDQDNGGILVSARSVFVPERSDPIKQLFFFAYEITIANVGTASAQLLTRHWIITDATGHVEEVIGEGVIGETPVIEPGEAYSYTSFCPLRTESGSMRGSYGMVRSDGTPFDAEIPEFHLNEPYLIN